MRRARLAWPFLLAAFSAWTVSTGLRENDTFWHLGLGRAVLREGTRVVREPWALLDEYRGTCVVPEWLWDVATYLIHRAWGFVGLHAFMLLVAGAVPLAVAWMLHATRPKLSLPTFFVASTIVSCALAYRLGERPEQWAFVMACGVMGCAAHWARSEPTRRAPRITTLSLLVVWAQTHGTSVLGPAIVLSLVVPSFCAEAWRARARADAGWLIACALSPFTGAHGFGLVPYVLSHASGDAVRHIADMEPTPWSAFNPATHVAGPLLLAMVIIGALGAARARRVDVSALALVLLGVAVAVTAIRGISFGALLAAPWFVDGLAAFAAEPSSDTRARSRLALAGAALVSLALIWAVERDIAHGSGPLGRFGLAREYFPLSSAKWLARVPAGTRALTSYSAGSVLGFELDGRVRTWVDSRTPMQFDDLDYALSRDGMADPASVRRATQRYGFDVAVVRRDRPECQAVLDSGLFDPVTTELRYTTFVRRDGPLATQALSSIVACGPAYVNASRCGDAQGFELDAQALARIDETFARFVRLEHLLRCGGELRRVGALVPPENEAVAYGERLDLLLGEALLAIGQGERAEALLLPRAEHGSLNAASLLTKWLSEHGEDARLARLLESYATTLDDASPTELWSSLADTCLRLDDLDCAAFYGLRAAARGRAPQHVLEVLGRRHPSARVRRAALRWRTQAEVDAEAAPR